MHFFSSYHLTHGRNKLGFSILLFEYSYVDDNETGLSFMVFFGHIAFIIPQCDTVFGTMSLFQTNYDPSTKIWSGLRLPPTFHRDVNAAQVLLQALNRNPEYVGQINENNGLQMTNGEIALNTVRVAQHMQALGIRSGDVVALLAENHHDVASVVFASIALAAPVNLLGPDFNLCKYFREYN